MQTGATPSGTEVPRCLGDVDLQRRMRSYSDANAAVTPERADVKWRYFWPLHSRAARARGDPPYLEQVVPRGMPAWRGTLDAWGGSLVDTVETIALLLAVGYGLREDAFTELLEAGHHLLAPTGALRMYRSCSCHASAAHQVSCTLPVGTCRLSCAASPLPQLLQLRSSPRVLKIKSQCAGCDLRAHARPGAVFAGYHYDFNFLTCHGKSRYPGLRAWLRDGSRLPVRVPDGCLLLQAGRQLAWLTGGDIEEGMHEVVCSEQTLAAVERARTDETRSLWRVSSTVFAHVGPDVVLRPIAGKREACDAYPPTPNREFVAAELRQLKLAADVATAP